MLIFDIFNVNQFYFQQIFLQLMVQFLIFMGTTIIININKYYTFFLALTKDGGSITENAIIKTSQLG
jgi:hypothetical protein